MHATSRHMQEIVCHHNMQITHDNEIPSADAGGNSNSNSMHHTITIAFKYNNKKEIPSADAGGVPHVLLDRRYQGAGQIVQLPFDR